MFSFSYPNYDILHKHILTSLLLVLSDVLIGRERYTCIPFT